MVSIIGGGPAGLMTAYKLSKKGFRADVFEEHKTIGKPIQCTGLVTNEILKLIKPDKDVLMNKIRSAVIHTRSRELELGVNDYVIERSRFDLQIKEMAQASGARIKLNHKINSLSNLRKKDNIIVGADGPNSFVRKKLNPAKSVRFLTGSQLRVKGKFDDDKFHVYMGDDFPGFFGWIVPENRKMARVGMASERNVSRHFKFFQKKMGISKENIIERNYGIIPLYEAGLKTQKNSTYLVGDAATQVKATTGGGVIPGLKAANCLAESIEKGKNYERLWRQRIGRELWMHAKVRKTLNNFSEKNYNQLINIMKKSRNKKLISKANRDNFTASGIKLAIQNPGLIRFLPKLF